MFRLVCGARASVTEARSDPAASQNLGSQGRRIITRASSLGWRRDGTARRQVSIGGTCISAGSCLPHKSQGLWRRGGEAVAPTARDRLASSGGSPREVSSPRRSQSWAFKYSNYEHDTRSPKQARGKEDRVSSFLEFVSQQHTFRPERRSSAFRQLHISTSGFHCKTRLTPWKITEELPCSRQEGPGGTVDI
ncbi:hypothetical protein PCASD_17063 [Puccinia coronata f. sp. avenae]|uniref:Uncharacterized protein n=1 Tax=Puccinia coronata f. sp. avenae TaxID=200324 RepID=A0A2N5SMF0_9BASI|nr:hypothetical protein PCASD_17063 [Puccinia coronata f. sp. avenae]